MRIEQEIGKKAWMVTVDEIQVRKEKMNDSFMSKSCLSLNVNSKVTVYSYTSIKLQLEKPAFAKPESYMIANTRRHNVLTQRLN